MYADDAFAWSPVIDYRLQLDSFELKYAMKILNMIRPFEMVRKPCLQKLYIF